MHKLYAERIQRLVPYAALNPRYETRNIMSRSAQTIRGHMPSGGGARGVNIESTLEALFALRAHAAATVRSFVEQPMQIEALQQALPISYTPDAAVCLASGEHCLVEVKREAELKTAEVLARITAIRRTTESVGIRLLCATDAELRRDAENARIRSVRIHARTFTPRETEALKGRLRKCSTFTVGEATEILGSRAAVLHLIAVRVLYVDYRQPLNSDAIVSPNPEEANHDLALFSDW